MCSNVVKPLSDLKADLHKPSKANERIPAPNTFLCALCQITLKCKYAAFGAFVHVQNQTVLRFYNSSGKALRTENRCYKKLSHRRVFGRSLEKKQEDMN